MCFSSCRPNNQMVIDTLYLHLQFFRFFFSFSIFLLILFDRNPVTENRFISNYPRNYGCLVTRCKSWRKVVGIAFELAIFPD